MLQRLDKVLNKWRKHHHTPGMVIGITSADEVMHLATSGTRNRALRVPIAGNTLFEIGSVTKTFTGIAVAQLAERGKLDLDASVLEYLPWARFESRHEPFTVRHMVTHTAGLPSGRADVISSWYRGLGIGKLQGSAAPGEYFSYSDFGFHLLSIVIEIASGQSYPVYIHDNIFEPLGMHDSEPALLNAMRSRLASGYEGNYDDRPYIRTHDLLAPPWYEHAEGDGCIASTPDDMMRFIRMLLNHGAIDGTPLISVDSFEQFKAPYARKDEKTHYGFGIEIRREDEYTALEHEGVIAGYRAYMGLVLSAGVGVIALQNGPGDPTTIGRYALELAMYERGHGDKPDDPEPGMFHPPSPRVNYEGTYYDHQGRAVEFVRAKDALVLRADGETIELDQITDHQFFADHSRVGVFPFRFNDESQTPDRVFHGPTVYKRDVKADTPADVPAEWVTFCGQYRAMSTLLSVFRVTTREGKLYFTTPDGEEEEMQHIEGRVYRVGKDPRCPEWIEFGDVVEGDVLKVSLAGSPYYRCVTEKLPDGLVA